MSGTGGPALLSFVIPLYNEHDGVHLLWSALRASGQQVVREGRAREWEAVIVDDGSVDGSGDALDAIARSDTRCRVVHHDANAGVGKAMHSGFLAARGDLVLYTDADLPFDLDLLGELLEPILGGVADVVVGRRIGRAREGRRRAVQSIAYNALVRVLFRLPMSDVNFACKVVGRDASPLDVRSRSAFFDAEWMIRAHRRKLRIHQVPVEFVPRRWGRSTMGSDQVRELLRDLVAYRRELWTGPDREEPA